MKYKLLSVLVILVSLIFSSIVWEIINLPKMTTTSNSLFDDLEILNNPINDPLRFIFFITIPLLSIVFLIQKKDKTFYKNISELIYFNNEPNVKINKDNNFQLNFFTYFIFFVLIV